MDEPVTAPAGGSAGRLLRWAGVAVVTALFGLLVWATLVAARGENLVSRIAAGERPSAPGVRLGVLWRDDSTWPATLRGALGDGAVDLEELRGRPAVLNFWASWCGPCRAEAPVFNDAARAYRGKIAFVGVNVRDGRSAALAFLREFSPPYPAIRDRGDEAYEAYGLTGVPETYYLDAEGRIVGHTPGPVDRASLKEGIAAATRWVPRGG